MEYTPYETRVLYLFEDRLGHRVVRQSQEGNLSTCSHCGGSMAMIAKIPRQADENDEMHERRTYRWRKR